VVLCLEAVAILSLRDPDGYTQSSEALGVENAPQDPRNERERDGNACPDVDERATGEHRRVHIAVSPQAITPFPGLREVRVLHAEPVRDLIEAKLLLKVAGLDDRSSEG
jgi:hypothetical protein